MKKNNKLSRKGTSREEITRRIETKKKLFELIPDVAETDSFYPVRDIGVLYNSAFEGVKKSNEEDGHPVPFQDASSTPLNIMYSYSDVIDMGKSIRQLAIDNNMDSMGTINSYTDLIRSGSAGILDQIASRVDAMIFDAYKTLMVKSSNYMHSTGRIVTIEVTSKEFTTEKDIKENEIVANSLIDEVCQALDNYVKNAAAIYAKACEPYGAVYIGSYTAGRKLVTAISNNLHLVGYDYIGRHSKYYYYDDDRDIAERMEFVKSIADISILFPSNMTASAFNEVYYAIAGSGWSNAEISMFMAAMDALGIFMEYHEKLVSISNWAYDIIEEYANEGILPKLSDDRPNGNGRGDNFGF